MIEIESVSSYEGSEGEAEYAGGQGKNAPKECFIEILQTYQESLFYYDYDYNSLYRFQMSSAILRLFSFEIADQNLQ